MYNSVLVIDEEQNFLDSVRRVLLRSGFKKVQLESDPLKAAALFEAKASFDVALIDVSMPGMSGLELLELIKANDQRIECIMVTAMNEARLAVECLQKGAYDYLVKPISKDDLVSAVKRAQERQRLLEILECGKTKIPPKLLNREVFNSIVTESAKVIRILKEAELHAWSDVPVLVTGESGTGKELLAKAIHLASPRAKFPFTPINMASLSNNLFDAEFFGHTKGAFTGAEKDRIGYLEQTHKGTLFLDEVGLLPNQLQGKFLRVLQDGEYLKLGTSELQKADIRLIAASNTDLERAMAKGMFRKDLYYRLKGAWLHLPPLRERKEDIPLLIEKFLDEFSDVAGNMWFEEEAILILMEYDYPGNIRELRSIVQSAMNLARGRSISANLLPRSLPRRKPTQQGCFQIKDSEIESFPLAPLAEMEKACILKVYKQMDRNKIQTAKLLGIGLNTLRRRLRTYGVE
jgi:DNA-binding NtrC family response regulator